VSEGELPWVEPAASAVGVASVTNAGRPLAQGGVLDELGVAVAEGGFEAAVVALGKVPRLDLLLETCPVGIFASGEPPM
jgi:hypothetical protein